MNMYVRTERTVYEFYNKEMGKFLFLGLSSCDFSGHPSFVFDFVRKLSQTQRLNCK